MSCDTKTKGEKRACPSHLCPPRKNPQKMGWDIVDIHEIASLKFWTASQKSETMAGGSAKTFPFKSKNTKYYINARVNKSP